IELRIEFASAADEKQIVSTVHGVAEQGPLALFVPNMNDGLAVYGPRIVTLYDYATARLEALRARGLTEQPLPRRYLTSTWAKTWPQVYDRRAALREAEILRLLGCNVIKGLDDAPGVNADDAQPLGVSWRFLEL